MTENLRIIFMGTPDFAVASLRAMVDKGFEICAVITAPDKPAGRGRKIKTSAVKDFALQKGLKVMQPANLKDPAFLDELRSLKADLQVVVAFRMLPEVVWQMPPRGTFNLHASLLPDYRGAAPINWAIINGERRTGVTTFFINEKIDTGALILQKECPIEATDTAGDLHDRLMNLGSDLVIETVEMIATGKVKTIDQRSGVEKQAPKLNKENCRIDWNKSLDEVYNHIRGLSPYPGAWTVLNSGTAETECKILNSHIRKSSHDLQPGSIRTSKKEISVAVQGGFLLIDELQLSGKRKMDAASFLNGFRFDPEDQFV